MNQFIVSARKYRPDHFNTVLGQKQVTETLKNAIRTGQLAQSFLFCGPRGVGKTSCARILAKTINCTNIGKDFEACGTCDSCMSFQNGNSFNIQELDAASNNSVEDIRGLVEQIRYAPQAGKYKIYIIDEVHMLSQNAFNAFLKTLEEPPSYVIFILATTEKQKIIPTILSRCQIFDFNRITVKDAADHLAYIAGEENIKFEPEGLHLIAQKSDGAMRDALSIFDQLSIFTSGNITYKAVIENLHILDFDYYFAVTEAILREDTAKVLLILDEILQNGFNGNDFLGGLSSYFRDLLVCKDESTIKLLEVMPQTQEKYIRHSKSVSPSFLLSALAITNQTEIHYRNSKNQRLQVELALLKLCHIPSVFRIPAPTLIDEELKKKRVPEVVAPLPLTGIESSLSSEPSILKPIITPKTNTQPISGAEIRFKIPKKEDIQLSQQKALEEGGISSQSFKRMKPVTGETLIKAWREYIKDLERKEDHGIYAVLNPISPEIEDDFVIRIKLQNSVHKNLVQEESDNILGFLRNELENDLLHFDLSVSFSETKDLAPFTSQDKLKYLIEINPVLEKLKDTLGLEIDY